MIATRNIKSERVRMGLSAAEAAKELNVSINTLRSWERGGTAPDGSYLTRMAAMYGCTTDYLLGLTEERT